MKRGVWSGHTPGPCIRSWSTGPRQGIAAHVGEEVLVTVPVDVARTDQPLEPAPASRRRPAASTLG